MTGKKVTILIDSGSTNNYIHIKSSIGETVPLLKPIKTRTLHGISIIKSKRIINILNNNLVFFDIEELNDYDMILGEQGLRQIKAKLCNIRTLYVRSTGINTPTLLINGQSILDSQTYNISLVFHYISIPTYTWLSPGKRTGNGSTGVTV